MAGRIFVSYRRAETAPRPAGSTTGWPNATPAAVVKDAAPAAAELDNSPRPRSGSSPVTTVDVVNRLKDATSPYLLQHADNPVDWWPWCEEAFAEAAGATCR